MDVWIKRLARMCQCNYCKKEIAKDEFVVNGRLWIDRQGKKWRRDLRWHTACWIEQGIEAIKEKEIREPKIETRGRKQLLLTPEQKAIRLRLMVRRATVIQRIKLEVAGKADIDKLIRLGTKLSQLRKDIEPYGGIPKKWIGNE